VKEYSFTPFFYSQNYDAQCIHRTTKRNKCVSGYGIVFVKIDEQPTSCYGINLSSSIFDKTQASVKIISG
jgi:hypothetical protein